MIAAAVVYFTGSYDYLKDSVFKSESTKISTNATSNNGNNGSNDVIPTSDSNEINVSLDEWIGWKSVIDANGGLITKSGSIFDELGIKVNIHVMNDATQSSNAMIKGDLDAAGYTVNRYAFLYPKFKTSNTEVVMPFITNFSTGGDGIIAKANINSVEDLVGKKIAVPRFSEAQTLVWWLLQKSSLSQDQIAKIQKDMVMFDTPDEAAKAFFAGQVDAAATWQPYLSQAQETTGAKLLFSTKQANSIVLDGIVFNKKFYDANKDTVAKFIEGTLNAVNLYTTEFTPIKDTMPLFATETNENITAMAGDATLATYNDNVKLLDDTAKTLFTDMSNIWKTIGEESAANDVAKAFDSQVVKSLSDKFETTVVTPSVPKVTEQQRETAKTQKNTQALLKKSTTINFQANSAAFVDMTEAAKALDEFVGIAKILDGSIIQIEGNIADTGVGDSESGRKLSEQRAKAVAMYLQQQGVDPTRFVIVGNGITKQTGDNKTEEGKKQNRRTDIFFKIVE
ncbi:putative aliphatic sulfonates-binding protein precursor [compost metagenome]